MYPTVIVPVDETPESERALPVAVVLATASGGQIELVTVDSPHSEASETASYHEGLVRSLPAPARARGVITRADAPVADQLLDVNARFPASILCLATAGRGTIGEALAGSVAADVIRQSAGRVLLVGPRAAASPSNDVLVGPVVAALDGTDLDTEVTAAAAELASTINEKVRLVHVITDLSDESTRAEGERVLEATEDLLAELGVSSTALLATAFDPAPVILEMTSVPTSALVVGSHRRGPFGRLAHAATAMWLVHRAPCPVMVVPPAEPVPAHA